MIYRQSKHKYLVEIPNSKSFGEALSRFVQDLRGEPEIMTVDLSPAAVRTLRDAMTQDLRKH